MSYVYADAQGNIVTTDVDSIHPVSAARAGWVKVQVANDAIVASNAVIDAAISSTEKDTLASRQVRELLLSLCEANGHTSTPAYTKVKAIDDSIVALRLKRVT